MTDALDRLAKQLVAIQDPALHGDAVRRFLTRHSPEDLVTALAKLLRRATEERFRVVLESLVDTLVAEDAPPLPYEALQEVYRVAITAGERGVALLLLDPPPRRGVIDGWAGDPDPALLDITLGERKSMARRPDRAELAKIARLTEPPVLRILLANPRLTETDVVTIAARRPHTVPALTEVVRCQRWRRAAAVRLALVQNPYLPPRLAVLLVPGLTRSELATVEEERGLHPLVREMVECLRELRERSSAAECPSPARCPGGTSSRCSRAR